MEILVIVLLILLNGLFSMSEIAVISARKSSLNNDAKHGNKAAQTALKLSGNPDKFLSTVQVGITLIGIITGLYSGDVLAVQFAPVLENIGIPANYAYPIAQVSIVIVVTYLTIIFGELVPKRIGLSAAEKISKLIARPMTLLSIIASPFVWVLSKSSSLVFNLLGVKKNEAKVTEDEIKSMIREGAEEGEVKAVEQDIMERAFNLGDRDLESIMTPRSDIVWLSTDMTKEEIKNVIKYDPFSKYPVGNKSLDDIEGIVYLKDLFGRIEDSDFNIKDIIKPAHYFYESMEVYSALEGMKSNHIHCALISDEFGTVRGIISLTDIMEALIGDIPKAGEDPEIIQRKDGSYLIDGQCSFYDFLSYFKLEDLYSKFEFNTLSGLILELLGHIPHEGEILTWKNFSLEIVDMDGARIDKVLVVKLGN